MKTNRVLTALAVPAIALGSLAVAHANPADDACRQQVAGILQSTHDSARAQQVMTDCENGLSPNNGQAYVPGKAGPGPQQAPAAPPVQVAQGDPPQNVFQNPAEIPPTYNPPQYVPPNQIQNPNEVPPSQPPPEDCSGHETFCGNS